MDDRKKLLYEIDHGFWNNLLVLGDLEEEEGRYEVAAGLRWLAKRRKHPKGTGVGWMWNTPARYKDLDEPKSTNILPRKVMSRLKGVRTKRLAETILRTAAIVGKMVVDEELE